MSGGAHPFQLSVEQVSIDTMASRPLTRFDLDESTVAALKNGLGVSTAGELLECSILEVMYATDLSLAKATSVVDTVAQRAAPQSEIALRMLQRRRSEDGFCKSGNDELDSALRGGWVLGTLTDVCGAPGVGKSQLCMGSALQTVIMDADAIYIDTEGKMDVRRLAEMARAKWPEQFDSSFNTRAVHNLDQLLTRIAIYKPDGCKGLEELLHSIENELIVRKVRLIVLDSIASLARSAGLDEREKETFVSTVSTRLKMLCEKCRCAALISNQVHIASSAVDHFGERLCERGVEMQPSLGVAWRHAVTTRLLLCREGNDETRSLIVAKSPLVAVCSLRCVISDAGLVKDRCADTSLVQDSE